ncbi:MAG: hypothetical protein DRJ98_04135 [Thermoprotei archaeon]|nr:MAG: hypothetical protein DRJ98_04135 [Thermoprotei archaeon]
MIRGIQADHDHSLERCSTVNKSFDEITMGGFVRGTLVLLAGNPDTRNGMFATRNFYEGLS